jgi:predicted ATPase/DNA-binding XRE family transcriptional regulator
MRLGTSPTRTPTVRTTLAGEAFGSVTPNRRRVERSGKYGAQPRSFGELLKMHRWAAGLSREQLAEGARLSAKTVSALEQGARQKPYRHTIANLSDALGLSPSARTELERAAVRGSPTPHARLRVPESRSNDLPSQLSSFVGREQDVAAVEELVSSHRLVTLVGAGGIGKTRLALQVAAGTIVDSYDGVWFVDFAPLTDPSQVPERVATVLGLQVAPASSTLEALCANLKHQRSLAIFDNCEHVIDVVARVAETLWRHCPSFAILVTSREALKVSGERTYRVPPLAVPECGEFDMLQAGRALRFGAIALFVDRAIAQDNRFALTQNLVPVVAAICRRLDGIALAIELAAARLNLLSPAALEKSLRERFDLLTLGSRAALPRHRTMTALIDWSYDHLSPKEQLLFRRLSIFVDGFTLELLSALSEQDSAIERKEVLELLASLVDKSLVQKETTRDETARYRLLESTREYALEKLKECDDYEIAAGVHARALLTLARPFDSVLELKPDRLWRSMAAVGAGNWRSAMEWSLELGGDVRTGQELAASRGFWFGQAPAESLRWVDVAVRRCGDDTPLFVRAKLELAAVRHATARGELQRIEALESAQRAVFYYQRADDRLGVAEAQAYVGLSLVLRNQIVEGKNRLKGALETAQVYSARWIIALATHALAVAHALEGDLETARRMFREALDLLKAVECDRYAAQVAGGLAQTEYLLGNAETAVQLSREAARSLEINRNSVMLADVRSVFLLALSRLDEARAEARQALILARDTAVPVPLTIALQRLAAIAARRAGDGDSERDSAFRAAARLLGFVDARLCALEYQRQDLERREYDALTSALRDVLGTGLRDLMEEGRRWSEGRAIAEAFRL